MPIRVFLCPWAVEVIDGQRHVVNPVSKRQEALDLPCSVNVHWPTALLTNGEPNKPMMLCLVKAAQGFDFAQFNALPGVYRIPAFKLSKQLSTIPAATKTAFLDKLAAKGIPKSTFAGATTWGGALKRIAKHMIPQHKGFRPDYLDADFE